MKIELCPIKIKDVVAGFLDSNEEGVVGYGGKLNIRPKYQREFIYDEKQQKAVMDTVVNGFPLNVMYWVKNADDTYEVLDGQQRTLSICNFCISKFHISLAGANYYFHNLTDEVKEAILNYELMVYICEGTDKEKLDWFKIINIAGEKLTNQELRNAIYTGTWLTDAKRYFSKTSCPAYQMANKLLKGTPIRQDYLETILKWISSKEGIDLEIYMAKHQHTPNAAELWLYFNNVITWVKTYFPKYRKEMQGVEWGLLYNKHAGKPLDAAALEKEVAKLMADTDVTKKAGIYSYVLDGDERNLSIRAFDARMKREAYEKQQGICIHCKQHFELEEMEADHITPWHLGGATIASNCQMLCRDCNRRKSGK